MNIMACGRLCVCGWVCVRRGAENESKYNVYLPCDCTVLNLNCILSLKFNRMTLLNTFVDCWKRL